MPRTDERRTCARSTPSRRTNPHHLRTSLVSAVQVLILVHGAARAGRRGRRRLDPQAPDRRHPHRRRHVSRGRTDGPVMTVTLLRGSHKPFIGRAIVDTSTGDPLAEVHDVVFSPDRGTITGFTLRRAGFFGRRLKTVLPIESVLSVGTDAVLVADAVHAITDPADQPDDMTATRRTTSSATRCSRCPGDRWERCATSSSSVGRHRESSASRSPGARSATA